MKRLGHTAKIIVVHGVDDTTAPFADAKEMVDSIKAAKLDVESLFVNKGLVDGKTFTGTGHTLGQRTEILFRVAEKYLRNGSPALLDRKGSTDFFRREAIKYPTTNGVYTISYENGFPIGRFDPKKP